MFFFFFNKWLVVSCGRQMFCCLHSSFLGELTFVTACIYSSVQQRRILHFSTLCSVQGNSIFHFDGTSPKLKKKKTNFWLSRFSNSWQGLGNSIHVKLINCRLITVSFPFEKRSTSKDPLFYFSPEKLVWLFLLENV